MSFNSSLEEIRKFDTGKCKARECETGECESGSWKLDRAFEAEGRDGSELLSFPNASSDERQEFRELLERLQRRARRPSRSWRR